MSIRILTGDCRAILPTLPADSVHCVVTSPPYWGLRDYGVAGQLGLEPTFTEFIDRMVEVFREVRRVLRPDGTLWLNLGDSYAFHDPGGYREGEFLNPGGRPPAKGQARNRAGNYRPGGLKPKDLVGIPWRVAFALQADGWWLRQDIIWSKPNPMPESVMDRCTKAHEYVFLLTKSARYFYDAEAIKEAANPEHFGRYKYEFWSEGTKEAKGSGRPDGASNTGGAKAMLETRNKRSVWEIATSPFPQAHFATFPPALVEPCIKAGTSEKGCCAKCGAPWERKMERATCTCQAPVVPCTVLDCFSGAGTTGLVADRLQRNGIMIELNPQYAEMARNRIYDDAPLLQAAE